MAGRIEVTGSGYDPVGKFHAADHELLSAHHPVLAMAARISLLCNDAALEENDGLWTVRGDPTEGALLVLGRKAGLNAEELLTTFPRMAEIPFSSEAKRMSTFHQDHGRLPDVSQRGPGKPGPPGFQGS